MIKATSGKQLGKYELQQKIGEGSTGEVYLAQDHFAQRQVAIKVLTAAVVHDQSLDDERRQQFLTEASLAGRLAHPHIAEIIEASITADSGYIVMEYVPKGNLSQFIYPDQLLPVEQVLQIIFKCCHALDYASRCGIIHRDLKPANIMLLNDTHVKIVDFGAATFYQQQHSGPTTLGTPSYMSPEQLGGKELSFLSDMYSLGVVTYELLTGNLPYLAASISDLYQQIQQRPPLAPSRERRELPPELDRIVLKMLAADPQQRYSSWTELADQIASLGNFNQTATFISDSEKFNTLRHSATLRHFSDPEIWELVQTSLWQRLPQNQLVLREDEAGSSMFFLVDGKIKVTKRGRLLNIINAGEYFGEMAYIQRGTSRQATLETVSESLIAEFPFEGLEKLSQSCELKIAKILLSTMTDRLMLAGNRIARMHG